MNNSQAQAAKAFTKKVTGREDRGTNTAMKMASDLADFLREWDEESEVVAMRHVVDLLKPLTTPSSSVNDILTILKEELLKLDKKDIKVRGEVVATREN